MKRAITFVLVGVLLAGCSAAQPSPTATLQPTATPQPSATPQPTATQTLPPPTATATVTPIPSPTYTPTPSINHVYAFGDSFSDNGTPVLTWREDVAQGKLDDKEEKMWETYLWEGRFSNGPVAVEILAEQLNAGLTDYAFHTATSGYMDADNKVKTGLLSQVDQFEADLKGVKADADALYFIFASMFDLWPCWDFNGDLTHDQQIASNCADQAILNNITAVTHLAGLGARKFIVVNSSEVSNTALAVQTGTVDACAVFQSRIKSEMPGMMENLAKQLNVEIVIFDWLAASNRIRSNPDQYGFTEINEPCLVGSEAGAIKCESPDEYFFWTGWDLTRRVHQIMGEAMAEQLTKWGFTIPNPLGFAASPFP